MAKLKANQGGKGGGKGVIIGVISVSVLVVVLMGAVIYLIASRGNGKQEEQKQEEKRNVVVSKDNVEEVIQQMDQQEVVPVGYYTVSQNFDWHFPSGKEASSDAYVENSTGNTNDVYFDLFLASDEENAIYKSPVIPIGASLQEIALDTPLDAGTYDCVLVYHLVDENQNSLSTLRVTVKLFIES